MVFPVLSLVIGLSYSALAVVSSIILQVCITYTPRDQDKLHVAPGTPFKAIDYNRNPI